MLEENDSIPELDKKKIVYGIKQSDEAIRLYKNHLFRAFAQNSTWEDMLKEHRTDTVYIHIDYPMNFIPSENRESQQNWFGKTVIILTFISS